MGIAGSAQRTVIFSLVLMGMIGASGCLSGNINQPGEKVVSADTELTEEELREELDNFGELFSATVQQTAEELGDTVKSKADERLRHQMRLRLMKTFYAMSEQDSPVAAFIEIWGFCVRLREYFEHGDGSSLYGESQHIAVSAAKRLEAKIESIGDMFLDDNTFIATKANIHGFAKGNPIEGRFSNLVAYAMETPKDEPNPFLSILNVPLAPFRVMEGVDRTATAVHKLRDSAEQFSDIVEELPESARWELLLLLYDLEEMDMTTSLLDSIAKFSESSARMAEYADTLPKRLREELSTLIEEIDKKQLGLQGTLDKADKTIASVERALVKGEEVADSLNRTADSVKNAAGAWEAAAGATTATLQEWIKIKSSPAKSSENAEPFRIEDYQETAEAVTKAAEELKELAAEIQILADGKNLESLVDHIVWRAALLLALVLLLSFFYRLAIGRLKKSGRATQK